MLVLYKITQLSSNLACPNFSSFRLFTTTKSTGINKQPKRAGRRTKNSKCTILSLGCAARKILRQFSRNASSHYNTNRSEQQLRASLRETEKQNAGKTHILRQKTKAKRNTTSILAYTNWDGSKMRIRRADRRSHHGYIHSKHE